MPTFCPVYPLDGALKWEGLQGEQVESQKNLQETSEAHRPLRHERPQGMAVHVNFITE
jgi:hypothetical protein